MNWKKIFTSLAIFAVGAAALAVAAFYMIDTLRIARGLKPVLLKAPQDITEIIPLVGSEIPEGKEEGKNETDMPLKLPEGFSISIFAKDLGGPRVMMWGPDGNVWTSIPSQGKVVALKDANGDGFAEGSVTVLDGLNRPHGMASRCNGARCTIYIAESHQVAAFEYEQGVLLKSKKKVADLPDGGRHFTRTLMFMPYPNENKLLISVGSSCDVCEEKDERRAKILALNVVSGEMKEFARGLRNSVFMATHPVTGKIWATEMGRDMLGDDLPPDEINIIAEGKNYGWPICYGKNVHDAAFDKNTYIRNPCMEPFETQSHVDIPAHSAPLGLAFFPEEGWPEEYWHDLLVAYHGSWNKSEPTGYKLVRYRLDEQGNYIGVEDFISGWLQSDGTVLGRPVDVLIQPGGVIFVSDDKAGVIYRIARAGKEDDVTEHIRSKADLIRVVAPGPGEAITSPITVKGEARGYWFFEASFPVKLFDGNGREIAVGIAQAEKEWMTTDFVPFSATLTFTKPSTAAGTLVFEKDNPSGLPEHADALRIPVVFEK
ncbi:PQQ-dependent sugar dehydrogenase [Candidatus Azambacteria bacterium]|nr:PQQ-dependent sugar dehydrogenase [Candidatus Azambacteria bacterium]